MTRFYWKIYFKLSVSLVAHMLEIHDLAAELGR